MNIKINFETNLSKNDNESEFSVSYVVSVKYDMFNFSNVLKHGARWRAYFTGESYRFQNLSFI